MLVFFGPAAQRPGKGHHRTVRLKRCPLWGLFAALINVARKLALTSRVLRVPKEAEVTPTALSSIGTVLAIDQLVSAQFADLIAFTRTSNISSICSDEFTNGGDMTALMWGKRPKALI